MSVNIIVKNRKDETIFYGIRFKINRIDEIELTELSEKTHIICCDVNVAKQVRDAIMDISNISTKTEYQLHNKSINDLPDDEFYGKFYSDELGGILIQEEMDRIWVQFDDYKVQEFYISNCAESLYDAKSPRDVCFIGTEVSWLNQFIGHKELWDNRKELINRVKQMRFFR